MISPISAINKNTVNRFIFFLLVFSSFMCAPANTEIYKQLLLCVYAKGFNFTVKIAPFNFKFFCSFGDVPVVFLKLFGNKGFFKMIPCFFERLEIIKNFLALIKGGLMSC